MLFTILNSPTASYFAHYLIMPIILGLDVGDVRIGVAISDELGFSAHPLCTINRKNRKGGHGGVI